MGKKGKNASGGCGSFITFVILLAIVGWWFFGGEKTPETPIAEYTLQELEVSPGDSNKKITAKIIVADGLDEEILKNTVTQVARDFHKEYPSSRVYVFAYKESDEVRQMYSAARCILDSTGKTEADISMLYNAQVEKEDVVSKIPEAKRREIFKAICVAELNAGKRAQIDLIEKYTGGRLPLETSTEDLIDVMNRLYPKHKNLIAEEGELLNKYNEEFALALQKKYEITSEEANNIAVEGLINTWAQE